MVPHEADGNKNFHHESYRINGYEGKKRGEVNAVRFYLFITMQLVAGGYFRQCREELRPLEVRML